MNNYLETRIAILGLAFHCRRKWSCDYQGLRGQRSFKNCNLNSTEREGFEKEPNPLKFHEKRDID
jgi:hypothetical protein